jgi:hypothetical protein
LQGIINHRNNTQRFKATFGGVTRKLMGRYTIGKISKSYKYYSEEDRKVIIGNKNR